MMEFLSQIFDTGFASRWDGACSGWTQSLAISSMVPDVAIGLGYFVIPFGMLCIGSVRKLFLGSVPTLFAAFILACGTGHLLDAAAHVFPFYRLVILAKYVTWATTWATVVVLLRSLKTVEVIPRAELQGIRDDLKRARQELESLKS
jgi:hypothetical protein